MYYIRICKGLADRGKLIPYTESVYDHTTRDTDWYRSLFLYNEEQKKIFETKGTVAGMTDLVTNRLFLDFDSPNDIELAKQDASKAVEKLASLGVNEQDIELYFSGKKGFSVELNLDTYLNPQQYDALHSNLTAGLSTADTVVTNPSRVIRVLLTKHPETKLLKFPLTVDKFKALNVEEIKQLCRSIDNVEDPHNFNWGEVNLDKSLYAVIVKPKPEPVVSLGDFDIRNLDMSKKPKFLDPARWALQNGYFYEGERSNALTCLAATYKNLGFGEEHTYRLLKGVAEVQSKLTGMDRFPDVEIYNNIISTVYGPHWRGGQYSLVDKNSWLYKYAEKYMILDKIAQDERNAPKTLVDVTDTFKNYVNNIEKNTILTGIKSLDDNVFLSTGANVLLVGAPSSGKCLGLNTPILMFDGSIKMVQDIRIGDVVMGDDSTPRNVLSICRGRELLYRVKQNRGIDYVVNKSHILSVKCAFNLPRKHIDIFTKNKVIDINVEDYFNKGATFKANYKGYKVGWDLGDEKVNLDPYMLGYWLGDGVSSQSKISTADFEVVDYFKEKIGEMELNMKVVGESGKCKTYNISGKRGLFFNLLKEYNLVNNKHIPNIYFKVSRKKRLALLAGLIDSDGSKHNKANLFFFSNKSAKLIQDVEYLCNSLGFTTRITKLKHRGSCIDGRKIGPSECLTLTISGIGVEEIPVIIKRKKCSKPKFRSDLSKLTFESLGEGDYYGFELDGNHRFLLADGTVTHNTSVALDILEKTGKSGIKSVFASLDMSKTRLYEKVMYRISGLRREDLYTTFKENKEAPFMAELQARYGNTYFFDKSAPTIQDIRDYVLECEKQSGEKVKLVMIDYFERVNSDKSDDTAASKQIAGEIQDLVNDLDVCVITLVQPNKASLGGDASNPLTSYTAIKGSSFLYQSARIILSIWRPFFNIKHSHDDRYMSMGILKNDLGEIGQLDFHWDGKRGEIRELEDFERRELETLLEAKERGDDEEDEDSVFIKNWNKKNKY